MISNDPDNRNLPSDYNRLTFWEHLDVLRSVVWRAIAVWVGMAILFFAFMPQIFGPVILGACNADFPTYRLLDKIASLWPATDFAVADNFHVELINTELASQFFIHVSAASWLALIASIPIILYFLWGFVSPALYPHERKHGRAAFVAGYLMFCVGMAVSYFVVFPLSVRFLSGYQLSESIPNIISITSYMDMFMNMLLIMGLMFELPLLAWLLGKLGLLSRRFFSRYRRHAIVALLILAAVITPTGDPFTLLAVFIPIYAVWELGAILTPKH